MPGELPDRRPPRPVDAALSLRGISFEYRPRRRPPLRVLSGISLELRRGEIVTIVGPSGCGKSTLLALGAGLLAPSAGEVLVEGAPSSGWPGKVGFMMQRDELFPWRTVIDNVMLGADVLRRDRRAARARAMDLIRLAGLSGFEDHYPVALSGGMRQRAAFLRTLMLDRSTILLDEPFGALDAITREEMQEWLLQFWAEFGLTLLLVTHDVDEAIFLSDRVLVQVGPPASIRLEETVPFERPRRYEAVVADPRFGELKGRLLHTIRSERAG